MKASTFPSILHRFAGHLLVTVLLALPAACGGGTTGGLVQNANTINSGQDVSGQGTLGCASRPATPDICARPPENNQGAGGGEGSGSSITSAGAPSLAGDAVTLLGLVYDFGGLDGLGNRILLAAGSEPASFSLGRFMLERLQILSNLEDQGLLHPALIMGVYTEPLISCSNGNDKVNIEHTDTALIVTFDNQDGCRYEGVTLQGGVTISGIASEGTPTNPGSDWSVGATFSFSNFSITQDSGKWELTGALAFSAQGQNGIVSGTIKVTAPLSVTISGQTLSLLRNFRIDYRSLSGSTELEVNGSLLRGTSGNSQLNLFTLQDEALVINPLSGIPPDIAGQVQGPFVEGTLVLQAIDSTTAVLDVVSAVDVTLTVNGVDIDLSWGDLLAASSLP